MRLTRRARPDLRSPAELRLVAHGLLNKEIAARLQLDAPTVEDSKRGAMAKLGVTTRAGVVRHALEHGWLA